MKHFLLHHIMGYSSNVPSHVDKFLPVIRIRPAAHSSSTAGLVRRALLHWHQRATSSVEDFSTELEQSQANNHITTLSGFSDLC
jgi:hypothetical protein